MQLSKKTLINSKVDNNIGLSAFVLAANFSGNLIGALHLKNDPSTLTSLISTMANETFAIISNETRFFDDGHLETPFEYLYDDNGSSILRLEHAPQLSRASVIKVIVLSVMAVISLLGNIATMWNIYKTRLTRRTSHHSWSAVYSLIFHLSIADVLVTGFCIIGEAVWCYTVQWLAGDFTCKVVKLFQMFSLYLSTYVLVLIGVDRWIAVKYPMKSLNMAKRCYRLLGGAYVLSFLLSLPQVSSDVIMFILSDIEKRTNYLANV